VRAFGFVMMATVWRWAGGSRGVIYDVQARTRAFVNGIIWNGSANIRNHSVAYLTQSRLATALSTLRLPLSSF
jgi:hypothetical protein